MASMVFGNVKITPRDKVVELTYNTVIRGEPGAIFTYESLPKLAELLKSYTKPKVAIEDDDDESWEDLI